MSETDRLQYLEELRRHETQISSLARTLVDLDRCLEAAARARDEAQRGLARHIAFINAQVMRHKISVALLQSRLPA
jgi:hypothetical protein